MIFFSVGIAENENTSVPTNGTDDIKTISRDGLIINYRLGPMYGFCHELDKKFIIGESNRTFDAGEIKAIADRFGEEINHARTLGNNILGLAITDTYQKRITLVNSITNSRPYFYHFQKGKFAFSTDFRQLEEAGIILEFNEDILPELLVYRIVVPPGSMCKGIFKMAAGQLIEIDMAEGTITRKRYWRPYDSEYGGSSSVESPDLKVEQIIKTGLEEVIGGHPRPTISLSGGNDSSLLAAISHSIDRRVKSVSTSFSFLDADDEETKYAEMAANKIGLAHRNFEWTPEQYLTGLIDSINLVEEPIDHLQTVLLHLLYKENAGEGQVLYINGLLADGVFGDDLHMSIYRNRRMLSFLRFTGLHKIYQFIFRLIQPDSYTLGFYAKNFGRNSASDQHILWTILQHVQFEQIEQFLSVGPDAVTASRRTLLKNYNKESILDQVTMVNIMCTMDLMIWHKLAERHGHHLFYPYMIPELVNYMNSVAWSDKLIEGKYIVKQLLKKYDFSGEFIYLPKRSFGCPTKYWALPDTLFQPLVDMATEMYPASYLRSLQSENYNKAMLLWNILNVFIWKKLFIERISARDLSTEVLERHRLLRKKQQKP